MEQQLNQIIGSLRDINNSLNSFGSDDITAIISIISLIVLFFYTYYTRQIAQAAVETMAENYRPIASCELKSGKNYFNQEQLQQNRELENDTRCMVVNHTKYNLTVFVNLNLKLDDKHEEIDLAYAGKKGWPVTSYQTINGHFDLSKKFNLGNVKKITMDLEVSYQSDVGKLYKNPPQHWHFDKENKSWINDIGLTV